MIAARIMVVAAALAADAAVARLGVYGDDDGLTVWSPQASARVGLPADVAVEAGYAADVISAATVDVRTAASPRGFEETRHELHAGPSWSWRPGATVHGGYLLSREPDYLSHAASAGASYEVFDRRLTLSAVYRLSSDTVGRSGEPSFARALRGHGGDLAAAFVLDRRTVASLAYTLQRLDGYQESPYRYVMVQGDDGPIPTPERVPDPRTRHAAALEARRALGRDLFARALYRFYRDDWGVASHTGEAELARSLAGDRAILAVRGRGYRQSAASFYETRYEGPPEMIPRWLTADKKLGRNVSALAGARAEWSVRDAGPLREARVEAGADVYWQRFQDFPPLRERRALIFSLGWTAAW